MKFEDMTTEDFKKLNLQQLRHRHLVKGIVKNGKVYAFYKYGKMNAWSNKPKEIDYNEIKIDSFENITEEQFLNVLGFTTKTTAKYIWLQKYLKGEVSGTYSEEKDGIYQNILFKKTFEEKDEQIRSLKEQLEKIRIRNAKLIEENNSLKEIMKETEKTRKKIEKAKIQFMDIFENIQNI